MFGRNFWSLLALIGIIVGTFCYVILIFQDQKIIENLEYEQYYKAGAATGISLAVLFLLFLTATSPQKTTGVKMVIMLLLIVGLLLEIIIMLVPIEDPNASYAKYAIITFNFLYRSYYVLSYIQEPWAQIAFGTMDDGLKAITPTAPSTKPAATSDDAGKAFKEKWYEIRSQARAKYGAENLIEADANGLINKAVNAGELNKSKYSEALAALKTKSGEAVTGIPVGGRRRK